MRPLLWLISLPFRALGYVAVVAAMIAGGLDLWRSVQRDEMVLTPLGEIWFQYSADTLNLMQAAIQRGVHPALWDPVFVSFIGLPAFLALMILAAVALLIAQLIYRPR